jgi:hypothetical protein
LPRELRCQKQDRTQGGLQQIQMTSALCMAPTNRHPSRTTIAKTCSTVGGYGLGFEAVDELAHALSSVFGGVLGHPFLEIES